MLQNVIGMIVRFQFVRRIKHGGLIPPLYGLAWNDWNWDGAVLMPVPFNMAAGMLRSAWVFLRCGWKSVPISARDAYWQGRRDERLSLHKHSAEEDFE
jgi:hypothetical protein